MRKCYAFTLIELLIVISTIAVLLAILMPALFRAREGALRVACAKNLGGISFAIGAYAADYDDQIITAREAFDKLHSLEYTLQVWFIQLLPYISENLYETNKGIFNNTTKAWFCPKDKDPYPIGLNKIYPHTTFASYALNGFCSDNEDSWSMSQLKLGPAGGYKFSHIQRPSSCMLMAETGYASQIYDAVYIGEKKGISIKKYGHHRMTSGFYHLGSMNVLFVDNHVSPIKGIPCEADSQFIPSNYTAGKYMFWPTLTLPDAESKPEFWGPGYQ